MGLPVQVEKQDENAEQCVYTFGTPDASFGRVVVDKDSGDVELADLSSPDEGPNERYYLAQVVPRLQAYHDRGSYPDTDHWDA